MQVKHYVSSITKISDVCKRIALPVITSMFIIIVLMIIASILMYTAENEAQPEIFNNALSGLWWEVINFAGHNNVTPVTAFGQILSAIYALLRICFLSIPLGIVFAGFIVKSRDEKITAKEKKHFCPYCGNNIDE